MLFILGLIMVSVGCGEAQPLIKESPDFGYQKPVYIPCVNGGDCQPDEICQQNICVPDPNSGTDGSTGDDLDAGGAPQDFGSQPQDTKPLDTKPPGPTVADTCPKPGDTQQVQGTFEACKIDPVTKALTWTSIVAASGIGAPCASNAHCDTMFGCHFEICTHYCELQFGGDNCNGTACMSVGHPLWGSCEGF
jgi:hypothetical protein